MACIYLNMERNWKVRDNKSVTLTDAELGLLILMLIEDLAKNHGPLEFQNVLTQDKANSGELLSKLMAVRESVQVKRVN